MKKGIALLILTFAALAAQADERSTAILTRMSAKLKAMGEYDVAFTIAAESFKASGRYSVSGREYYMTLGDGEVFCDGETFYEVNKALEEITIDRVNPSDRNILNNPVSGLDFIGEEFASEIVSQSGATTVIRLTPVNGAANSAIEVTVDNTAQLPSRIVYLMASDSITVELVSINKSAAPLPHFDAAAYPDYEIIDFR